MKSIVLAVVLLVASVLPVVAATWTENWASGVGAWGDPWGNPSTCVASGGVLHQTSTCDGMFFSRQRWSHLLPVSAHTTIRGAPLNGAKTWCGLALIQDFQVYGQWGFGDVAPARVKKNQWNGVWWNNETGGRYYHTGQVSKTAWQDVTVRWTPNQDKSGNGVWSATVNGQAMTPISARLTAPLAVDLQGKPWAGECTYGSVLVEGTPV